MKTLFVTVNNKKIFNNFLFLLVIFFLFVPFNKLHANKQGPLKLKEIVINANNYLSIEYLTVSVFSCKDTSLFMRKIISVDENLSISQLPSGEYFYIIQHIIGYKPIVVNKLFVN
ncbi:MAG: hypothetical protein A2X02_00135 [Bacteroidetes bacterium GWF2_29_10]|nr:MAG: hypothetical protein A2X02_00135 [Bacteroidetes bacterium GWF2_29_10]